VTTIIVRVFYLGMTFGNVKSLLGLENVWKFIFKIA